jgi:hypothetical protein
MVTPNRSAAAPSARPTAEKQRRLRFRRAGFRNGPPVSRVDVELFGVRAAVGVRAGGRALRGRVRAAILRACC